jgi:uncharacterized membrane protein
MTVPAPTAPAASREQPAASREPPAASREPPAASREPRAASSANRRGYVDWMRGLAVLVMIIAHVLDAWTRAADKQTTAYWYCMVVAGFGAPMFLFLAGVAVALAGDARLRRGTDVVQAGRGLMRRGWQIFGLAFLFRLQAYVLSPGATLVGLFKVDILNVMGLALAGAAWLWARAGARRVLWAFAAAGLIALATPLVRTTALLAPLPNLLEWYFRPYPGRTNFTLLPWAGFVFAGLGVGVWLAEARDAVAEARLHRRLVVGALAAGVAVWLGSYLPSVLPGSAFWTSSPSFFAIRCAVLVILLSLCYLYGRRPGAGRWSPLEQFGRTSLFVYWIHVEMVYGVVARPLRGAFPLWQSFVAFGVFTLVLLMLSLGWSKLKRKVSTYS